MALIKAKQKETFGTTLNFENAYHKISQMVISVETISISVEIFNDESKSVLLEIKHYTFQETSYIGSDIIQIGYGLFKTLPEYEGAINAFEEGQPLRELAKNI